MKQCQANKNRRRTRLAIAGFSAWVVAITVLLIHYQGRGAAPTFVAKAQAAGAPSYGFGFDFHLSDLPWFEKASTRPTRVKPLTPEDIRTLSPEALMTRMCEWVEQAPIKALIYATTYLREAPLDEILDFALEEAGRLHFPEARDWVLRQPEDMQSRWLTSLFAGLYRNSPLDAANQTQVITDIPTRKTILAGVIERWTLENPQEAALWLNSQALTPEYQTARVAWLHHGGVKNLSLSLDALSRIGEMSERTAAATYIAEQWADRYPDTVGEWLELIRVADESSYSPAVQATLISLSGKPDYQWTALKLATQPYQGVVQNDWVFGVIQRIAERAPEDIAFKLMELPSESRAFAAEFITEKWLQKDSIAAEAWVGSLVNPVERDYAKRALFNYYAQREPLHASNIKSSIDDPFLRQALELPQYDN